MPVIKGDLEAKILDEVMLFSWGDIFGDCTFIGIFMCHKKEDNCVGIYNITDLSVSVYAVDIVHNDEIYILRIYQDTEVVLTEEFGISYISK